MRTERKAFTLMEMVVYVFLFALVGAAVAAMFSIARRTQNTAAAAYAVSGEVDTCMAWVRRELQETALATLQVAKPSGGDTLKTMISFCSARLAGDPKTQGQLLVSEYGVPRWATNVFYAVRRQSGSDKTGDLVRWEHALPANELDRLPKLATMPTTLSGSDKPRVLLHGVLGPGQMVSGLGGTPPAPSDWGGFRVQFVRRKGGEAGAESMADTNPATNFAKAGDNTRLVEIELRISSSTMGRSNYFGVKFRVCPHY